MKPDGEEIIALSSGHSESLAKALEKLEKVKELIAYPNEVLNQSLVDRYYKDLRIDGRLKAKRGF